MDGVVGRGLFFLLLVALAAPLVRAAQTPPPPPSERPHAKCFNATSPVTYTPESGCGEFFQAVSFPGDTLSLTLAQAPAATGPGAYSDGGIVIGSCAVKFFYDPRHQELILPPMINISLENGLPITANAEGITLGGEWFFGAENCSTGIKPTANDNALSWTWVNVSMEYPSPSIEFQLQNDAAIFLPPTTVASTTTTTPDPTSTSTETPPPGQTTPPPPPQPPVTEDPAGGTTSNTSHTGTTQEPSNSTTGGHLQGGDDSKKDTSFADDDGKITTCGLWGIALIVLIIIVLLILLSVGIGFCCYARKKNRQIEEAKAKQAAAERAQLRTGKEKKEEQEIPPTGKEVEGVHVITDKEAHERAAAVKAAEKETPVPMKAPEPQKEAIVEPKDSDEQKAPAAPASAEPKDATDQKGSAEKKESPPKKEPGEKKQSNSQYLPPYASARPSAE